MRQQFVHLRGRRVGQQHRSGLGIQGLDLTDPVVLLVRAGELVAPDAVAVIGRHGSSRHQPGLDVLPHGKAVHVIAGFGVALQYSLPEHPCQVLGAFGVNRWIIRIGLGRQIDLSLGNMQKTPGLPRGTGTRFCAAQDIIGRSHHSGGLGGHGPKTGKRTNQRHVAFLT